MRTRIIFLLLILSITAQAQVSYWFSQFQKQGNAQLAQQYFFKAGTNIVITFDGQYVYINSASALNPSIITNIIGNYVFRGGDTMYGTLTNGVPNNETNLTLSGEDQVAIRFAFTNLGASSDLVYNFEGFTFGDDVRTPGGFFAGDGFYGDAEFLTNFPGLTTNFAVLTPGGFTNVMYFTGGVLYAISSASPPSHGPSLLLEGGGYILLESGGTILKE